MTDLSYPSIGYHTNIADLQLAVQRGATAAQIGLSELSNFVCEPPLSTELVNIILNYKLKLFVHGKYVINLARKDFNLNCLIPEIIEANRLKADIVIHQGKRLTMRTEEAIDNYINNVKSALLLTSSCNNRILLENSAHQGTELGYALDELATIFKRINDKRVGICLDLCHVHVAGQMDMNDAHSVRTWMEQFDILIGLNNLKLIHFNGSKIEFNGCNDEHDNLLIGKIHKSDGYRIIAQIAHEWQIPIILETPRDIHMHEMQLIRSFIKGNQTFELIYLEKYGRI